MKGLLLKDLYNLRQQGRTYLVLTAIWVTISIYQKNEAFFGGVIMIFGLLSAISALAYDEKARWDKYALTMPVSRASAVISKYILMYITLAVGTVMSIIVGMIISKNPLEVLVENCVFFGLGLFMGSLVLPIVFKFGVEKGRLIMTAIVVVPVLASVVFSKYGKSIGNINELIITIIGVAIVIIVAVISPIVSIGIYNRKEFN